MIDEAGTGSTTSAFVADRAWDVQWSYDCSRQGGHGLFALDVFNSDGTPDFEFPGVSEEGGGDSGVYHVPTKGRFHLEITTTCTWKMKVLER